jgi:hypothetical protein
MPTTVITGAEQATAGMADPPALSTSGVLSAGKVIAVDLDEGAGNWSTNARLRLRYSADAAGGRPTSLFLKMVRTHLDDDESFSGSEVRYYTRDYVDVPDAPLVRCHDAAHSTVDQAYHLLLDDVTATGVEATGRRPTVESMRSPWPTGWLRCTPAGGAPTGWPGPASRSMTRRTSSTSLTLPRPASRMCWGTA